MRTPKTYATHVTTPDGQRVYVRGKNKEELEQKVAKLRVDIGSGLKANDKTTFEAYARIWLAAYKAPPKLRQSSYETLVINLERHVIPYFGGMLMRDIKPMHVQLYLNTIAHLSRSVQAKCIQIARSIMDTAVENGLIPRTPFSRNDRPSGEEQKEQEALTMDQAARLLDAVHGTRAYLFCLLALCTGMRRGEILGLMWEDVDLCASVITVQHSKAFPSSANDAPVTTTLKTDAASRRLPIPPVLLNALAQEQRTSTSKYVLSMSDGSSLTRSAFRTLWSIVTSRSMVTEPGEDKPKPPSKNRVLDFTCHPHQLRHTYITHLFESGLDIKQVQYLAGHSTPEMTIRVYTHYRMKARETETADQVSAAMEYLISEPRATDLPPVALGTQ